MKTMRRNLLLAYAAFASVATFGAVDFSVADVEIVVAPESCDVVRYAANELSDLLGKTLGGKVPVRMDFTDGKKAIVLGTNVWAAAAGVTTEGVARDGYRIKTVGSRVFIAGIDDPEADMSGWMAGMSAKGHNDRFMRGTYNGMLEFAERYAGVRFYFPGELGTVIRPQSTICVPDTDLNDKPYFEIRTFSRGKSMGQWYEPISDEAFGKVSREYILHLRYPSDRLICCHGQIRSHAAERFAADHPDWLLMREDGTRAPSQVKKGKSANAIQLCPSSGVWDEIYRDAAAFFTGQDVSTRAIPSAYGGMAKRWPSTLCGEDRYGKWFDVMPNDGMGRCYCDRCRPLLGPTNDFDFANELVWTKTAEIANRLKRDGIGGRLTQMAYRPYRRVPKVEIPDNVDVMVSESGPWSVAAKWKLDRDNAEVKSWVDKLGRKVWLWNYANKYGKRKIPGLPALAPRAYGVYYKGVRDLSRGAYCESETDRMSFNWLNQYVYMKLLWNVDLDVEELLAEHHRLLFGAAASEMAKVFDRLEEKWTKDMVGTFVDTPLGPSLSVPDQDVIRDRIYTKAFVAELDALFDAAKAKVAADSAEAKRLALFRHEFRDGIARFAGLPVEEPKRATYEDRWVHVRNDLTSDAKLARFGKVARRAVESGFNGILFDGGLGGEGMDFHRGNGARLARLQEVKAYCRKLGLELIPMVWSVGRAHAITSYDANLAEGLPVRGVPYVCTGKTAVFAGKGDPVSADLFVGAQTLDANGRRGMRCGFPAKPYRRYAVKLTATTEDFKRSGGTGINVYTVRSSVSFNANDKGGCLGGFSCPAENRRNREIYFEFVTRGDAEANVSASLYSRADSGRVAIGSVEVWEIGIRRPIVRDGAPFAVCDAETGVRYEAGKDYLVPKSNAALPTAKDRDVVLSIPAGSAIRPGAKLLVDAYESARFSESQVGACLSHPGLYGYFEKSAQAIDSLFDHPGKWFLSMDEIRAGGTCESCRASGKNRAQALAECLSRQRDAIRRVRPDALIYAWSDMYDPYVNANPDRRLDDYALCAGGYGFDELKVPKDIIAVVWGGKDTAEKSLRYFADRGYATLYAGFYDVCNPLHFRVQGVVPLVNRILNCRGAIYTTWTDGKYDLLPQFGKCFEVYSNPLR